MSASAPSTNDHLIWSGTAWTPTAFTSLPASLASSTATQVLVPNGSAGAPSYSFSSYPAGGIFNNTLGPELVANTGAGIAYVINGYFNLRSGVLLGWDSGNYIRSGGTATLTLGSVDAASPVAQTLSVQGARGGVDTNVAGVTTTIQGSLGTGTGASGALVFKTGTPQNSGTTQHPAATILTLKDSGSAGTSAPQALFADGSLSNPSIASATTPGSGLYFPGSTSAVISVNGNGAAWFTNACLGPSGLRNSPAWCALGNIGIWLDPTDTFAWGSAANVGSASRDTFIGRRAAATVNLGAADAASPVAQTLSVQGARGGVDSNVAGTTTTFQGSLGTGTGASGALVFKAGTPQNSGSTQHPAVTVLTLTDSGSAGTSAPQVLVPDGSAAAPSYSFSNTTNGGIWRSGSNWLMFTGAGTQTGLSVSQADGTIRIGTVGTNWNFFSAVSTGGGVRAAADSPLGFSNTSGDASATQDVFLTRRTAATLNLGAADAASPVAQTISFQGARGATDTNVAGATATVQGSLGTGNGASGAVVIKAGTPQASGTTQHVATTVVTFDDKGLLGTAKPQITTGAQVALSGATAPSLTCSGCGVGPTLALDTGSGTLAGIGNITFGTGPSSSGTFTITFSSVGSNTPVCVGNLMNSGTSWNARATLIVNSASTTTCVFNWDNNSVSFSSANTVKFTYHVIGK